MKPLVLLVMDGWGIAPPSPGNAITRAHPRIFNDICKHNPYTELHASGTHVGLLPGYIGNSEVGHLHIGSGRLEEQDLAYIQHNIRSKRMLKNTVLTRAMHAAKHTRLHLLGLVSDGGVHSHLTHIYGLLDMAARHGIEHVYVHAITDGRDVPPQSATTYLKQLDRKLRAINKNWRIATVIGRYYAMDRDNRWNREHKAYSVMVRDEGYRARSWQDAITHAYARGETDEFIRPTIITDDSYRIGDGDTVIFFNFRSDRARQLTHAFVDGTFNKFKRPRKLRLNFVCLTQYDERINAPVAYPPRIVTNSFGETISKHGHRQLRIAETEKYAHVTYFFNGLREHPFPREERILIPSPKVTTYDKRPLMQLDRITRAATNAITSRKYSFILINYANADMLGHTGNIPATIKALRHQDTCIATLRTTCERNGFILAITSDHGNAEQLRYPDGTTCTAHTTNKVPLVILNAGMFRLRRGGALYHIAPPQP